SRTTWERARWIESASRASYASRIPSRKQRRREAKAKRHEYEFVYVDSEGNELEEVPEEFAEGTGAKVSRNPEDAAAEVRRNGSSAPTPPKKPPPARGGPRQPPVPSWNRAFKRPGLLGVV